MIPALSEKLLLAFVTLGQGVEIAGWRSANV